MQYLGGKTRIAKQIAAEINKVRRPGQLVWDAFCGGLSVSRALLKNGPVLSTDACAPLIHLYLAVQRGWEPPTHVSRETYAAAKLLPDEDPMKGFCGFGVSAFGKWFGGYAGGRKMPNGTYIEYAASAARALKRDVRGARFAIIDFFSEPPRPANLVLYCDIPYEDTTEYAGVPAFNHKDFYCRAEAWGRHCPVFISSYRCPVGSVVWTAPSPGGCGLKKAGAATEKLFYLAPAPATR